MAVFILLSALTWLACLGILPAFLDFFFAVLITFRLTHSGTAFFFAVLISALLHFRSISVTHSGTAFFFAVFILLFRSISYRHFGYFGLVLLSTFTFITFFAVFISASLFLFRLRCVYFGFRRSFSTLFRLYFTLRCFDFGFRRSFSSRFAVLITFFTLRFSLSSLCLFRLVSSHFWRL